MLYILAAALFLMGAPLAAIGTFFVKRIRDFNARSIMTSGRIVGHRESRIRSGTSGPSSPVFFPYVDFTMHDGRVVRVQGLGDRNPPQPGTPVSLQYDPLRPDDVSFTGPRGRGGVASALRSLGFTMMLLSLCAAAAGFALQYGKP